MPSLHAAGWRQGSIVSTELSVTIHTNTGNVDCLATIAHGQWLLAEQDCDLEQTPAEDGEKLFELRAIRAHDGKVPSSIGGRETRIDADRCLVAMDIVAKVTARWLTAHADSRTQIPPNRRRAIKTWLGFRYDRPAVPAECAIAHQRLINLAKSERKDVRSEDVRDVFVDYVQTTGHPLIANLQAVIEDGADGAPIHRWLERIRDAVSLDEHFIVGDVNFGTTDEVALSITERAFSLYADHHSLATATPDSGTPA